MLVLTRKLEEQILIGDDIKITLLKVRGNSVRIGIEAPREVRVVRGEIEQRREQTEAKDANQMEDASLAHHESVFAHSDDQHRSPDRSRRPETEAAPATRIASRTPCRRITVGRRRQSQVFVGGVERSGEGAYLHAATPAAVSVE